MSQFPPSTPPDPPAAETTKKRDSKSTPSNVEGEAYPGHFGGYKGSEPRELAERTAEERDLIDAGHSIADAMRLAGSENKLAQ